MKIDPNVFPEPSAGKSHAPDSILRVLRSNSKPLGLDLPRRESRSEINFLLVILVYGSDSAALLHFLYG